MSKWGSTCLLCNPLVSSQRSVISVHREKRLYNKNKYTEILYTESVLWSDQGFWSIVLIFMILSSAELICEGLTVCSTCVNVCVCVCAHWCAGSNLSDSYVELEGWCFQILKLFSVNIKLGMTAAVGMIVFIVVCLRLKRQPEERLRWWPVWTQKKQVIKPFRQSVNQSEKQNSLLAAS